MGCLFQSHIFIYMRCYVYLHRRLDTNEVFYVGRGTKNKKCSGNCHSNTYRRAYTKHKHNVRWMRIVEKTDWSVEILEDGLSLEDSKRLEIFYIKKYGRSDLNEGKLVNFTDGGEGSLGIKASDLSILTQRNRMKSELNPMKDKKNRKKQSIRMKENNPMKNKKVSEKMSISMKKYWSENEHPLKNKKRDDVRERNLTSNPTKNPEAIKKMREKALLRKNKGGDSPNAKKVKFVETGKIYTSIKECMIDINVSHTTIFRYLKNGKVVYV